LGSGQEADIPQPRRVAIASVSCRPCACGRTEADGSITIDLPLTQNDLADHLGVTRQAVQREIGGLKRLGVLTKRDGLWRVVDATILKRLAA
jgi:CRP-like cAMP-binding protein